MEDFYRDLDEGFNGDDASNKFQGRSWALISGSPVGRSAFQAPCQLSACSTKKFKLPSPEISQSSSSNLNKKRFEMLSIYPDYKVNSYYLYLG
jgi:hypothetical protein